tara:strand:- start:1662 stop:1931 length:270 start_codon:yes stop_codon:yes gene_type:complete
MPKKPTNKLSLADLIDALPSVDVASSDLKALILQLILDTPTDDPQKPYANRSRVKLEALKLLSDINRQDSVSDYEADLLEILGPDDEEN